MDDDHHELSSVSRVERSSGCFFPLAIFLSLIIGLLVPSFYDWTGANQSRSTSRVTNTAVVLTVGMVVVWITLLCVPKAGDSRALVCRQIDGARPWTFSSRTLFVITAVIAGLLVALIRAPLFVSGALCAIAYSYVIWFWIQMRGRRWQTTALLASMTFPFVWILGYDGVGNAFPAILGIAAAMPGFFPAALIGSLFHQNPNDLLWIGFLLTAAELILGTAFIRHGVRSTMAYLVFLLWMATFGSFGLNALIRA